MKQLLGILSVIVMFGMAGYSIFFSTSPAISENQTENTQSSTQESEAKKTAVQKEFPDLKASDWNMVLVGPSNKITSEVAEDQLTTLSDNSHQLDSRVADAYEQFSNAATEAGYPLVVISSFRSVATQEQVFNANVQTLEAQGYSAEEANTETKKTITEPGFSEHHTGLAIDVVDQSWYNNYSTTVLDSAYGEQPGAQWIAENAPKYGFIIRYPEGEEAVTGITYEPWHLRYVGVAEAEYISEHNMTFEAFLNQLNGN